MAHTHTQSNDLSTKPESNADFAEAVAKGYEPHDLKLRAIFVFIAVLSMTLVVVFFFIYAIMMALAAYDRSRDAVSSPVTVTLAPVYAPLQPSVEHDWLDQDDMLLMRAKTQAALAASGISSTGRRFIPITEAIKLVAENKMLTVRPAIAAIEQPQNPPGTYEGWTPGLHPATQPSNVD